MFVILLKRHSGIFGEDQDMLISRTEERHKNLLRLKDDP